MVQWTSAEPAARVARDFAGFEQLLVAEISRSLERLGLSTDDFQVSIQPAKARGADANPLAQQIPVTNGAAASPPPADPLDVLRSALAEAGFDPEGFNLSVARETVNYPGGSYVNHLVRAHFANGLAESFDVALMLRDPQVTVQEMRRAAAFRAPSDVHV